MYHLQSRYYDPVVGRFINADDTSNLAANANVLGFNLYAYCGNSVINREDESGEAWFFSVAIGLATQYAGDVVGNILSEKKGMDIFTPTSTLGEYVASGVTALIPGSGLAGAFVRNVVTEGIKSTEKLMKGQQTSFLNSAISVIAGTTLDAGFEKVTNKIVKKISTAAPTNYSSYANKVRKRNPIFSREQILVSMRRSLRTNRITQGAVAYGMDVGRTLLPY